MSNLLLVTDHIFSLYKNQLFDNYCFGQDFFEDYLSCFKNIELVARVRIHNNRPSGLKEIQTKRIHLNPIPNTTGIPWILYSKKLTYDILNSIQGKFDYTISRVPSQSGYWAARYSYKRNIPFMVEIIGDPSESITHINSFNPLYRIFSKIETEKLKKISLVAKCISYVNKEPLSSRYPSNDNAKKDYISSIRLPANKIIFSKQFVNLNTINIVHVGSLIPIKKQIDILKCARILKTRNINFHLNIIGGGPLMSQLKYMAVNLEIADNISFLGHISNDETIISYYDNAHLFILTSASEGLPRSMIEAMARGLPVISTNVGGIPEIISPEYLVSVGDYFGMAEKIISLFKNKLDDIPAISMNNIIIARKFANEVLSAKRKNLYDYLRN